MRGRTDNWRVWTRRWSLFVLCAFVTHFVSESFHHAFVAHVTCLEHGEQLHHDHHGESHDGHDDEHHKNKVTHQDESHDFQRTLRWHPAPAQEHGHHICELCLEHRKKKRSLTKRSVLTIKTDSLPSRPRLRQNTLLIPGEPLFRLAPKASPPPSA
ncbi:MAG: hypothetical protein EP343_27020 [Deltaproteobacteria bacterium]|nr:MAG: hypothetical protein EP343_27020 [Deltaproteobacteria bacterium]